jgi:hypothetical protein
MSVSVAMVNDPYLTVVGNKKHVVADVTFDSSYPTGGEALTAANLGMTKIDYAECNVKAVGGTVNVANVYYDRANSKIQVFDETPAEVTDTATLATLVVQVKAVGY